MALDQIQYAAVRHFKGPAMILAGPGSGKTTVITHRVWSLIKDRGVSQERILVITFTKMAANEMKERFLKMGGITSTDVDFGTFHAVFFMILKDAYGFNSDDIVKVSQQYRFIKTQLLLYGIEYDDENGSIGDILSEIAKVKGISGIDIADYTSKSCDSELFIRMYQEYEKWLRSSHMVDFEDMMRMTYELFQKDESILKKWQGKYEYVLIDEFQDASPIQFEIVNKLVANHRNIFIVGDDDQSIYGFRCAAPAVMQEFKSVYNDAGIYTLNVNYRSDAMIVESATKLINVNKDRFYKDLRAFKDKDTEIKKCYFETSDDENSYILNLLKDKKPTAILTRTNSAGLELKRYLEYNGVIQCGANNDNKVFIHWIALDIAAYIKIAAGDNTRYNYVRIINKPVRYVSRQYFIHDPVDVDFIIARMRQGMQESLTDAMCRLKEHISMLSKLTPFAGINYIRKMIGYDRYIIEYAKEHDIEPEKLMNIADIIQISSKQFKDYGSWLSFVEDEIEKNGHNKQEEKKISDDITVCTMHSSKGLEFERVIIIDANEGITPYRKAVTDADIEEERRLFYVAMTRAKKELIVCCIHRQYNKLLLPSRFLNEF